MADTQTIDRKPIGTTVSAARRTSRLRRHARLRKKVAGTDPKSLYPWINQNVADDAALQAAFVPVFTEQLERGRKIEAFRLASTLIFAATLVLGLITALFILLAPWVMPLFAPGYSGAELDLTVSLSRVLFPILIMLGVSGIVVGVLNSYNRFGVFAIAPFFWNVAIVAVLVGLAPAFPSGDEIYAYAIGVVVGTALQLAMVAYDLRNTPFRLRRVFEWRSGLVKRVLLLMLPVTISLGLINFNLAINGIFGSLVPGEGEDAPAAIDKAFRAAGIEIPFPQRDVHVKSLPAGAATPGARAHTG